MFKWSVVVVSRKKVQIISGDALITTEELCINGTDMKEDPSRRQTHLKSFLVENDCTYSLLQRFSTYRNSF